MAKIPHPASPPFRLGEPAEGPFGGETKSLKDKIWETPPHYNLENEPGFSPQEIQKLLQIDHESLRTELLGSLEAHFPPARQAEVGAKLTTASLQRARKDGHYWTPALDRAARQFLEGQERERREALEHEAVEQALREQLGGLGQWIARQQDPKKLTDLLGFRSSTIFHTLIDHNKHWTPNLVGKFTIYACRRVQGVGALKAVLEHLMNVEQLSSQALQSFLEQLPASHPENTSLAEPIRAAANHPASTPEVAHQILTVFGLARQSIRDTEQLLESRSFQKAPIARRQLLERETWDALTLMLEGVVQDRFDLDRQELVEYMSRRHPDRLAQYLRETNRRSILWSRAEIELFLASHSHPLRQVGLRAARGLPQQNDTPRERSR